jgi:hypothetical protein
MAFGRVFCGVVCLVAMGVRVGHLDRVDGGNLHEVGLLAASEGRHWVLLQ